MSAEESLQLQILKTYFQDLHSSMLENFKDIKSSVDSLALSQRNEPPIVPLQRKDSLQTADGSVHSLQGLLKQASGILSRVFQGESRTITSNPLDEVERVLVQLKAQNDQLKAERDELRLESSRAQDRLDLMMQKYQESETQQLKYKELNTKFRAMIVNSAGTSHEIDEVAVRQMFCELRARTQTLVQQYCNVLTLRVLKSENPQYKKLHQMQKKVYSRWNSDVLESERFGMVRAVVFEILLDEILDQPCFGLEDKLERSFMAFEEKIKKINAGTTPALVEWRTQTLGCANRLGNQSSRPEHVADLIYDFLLPVLPLNSNQNNEDVHEKVGAHILDLCQKSYSMALSLRQSNADYQVVPVPVGASFMGYEEQLFTPQDFNGSSKQLIGSRVALTLFGALVKYPEGAGAGERHVLEKAHVVCKV